MTKKQILFSAALLLAASSAMAQGNGMAGITEATSMVTSYFDPVTKLIYAIGAVVGLIGGVKVYGKFSSGDPDTSKTCHTPLHPQSTRHLENRCKLVWSLYLPDCSRHYSPLILLIIKLWLSFQSTEGLESRLSLRA